MARDVLTLRGRCSERLVLETTAFEQGQWVVFLWLVLYDDMSK